MSPVKSEKKYVVSELSYFKPSEDRKYVVTSLEEWAARILMPDIPMILKEAIKNTDTNARFTYAKKPSKFLINECDYKNIVSDDSDDEPTINTSPDKYKHSTKEELFLKISTGLLNILTSASKKKISPKNSRLEKSVRLKAFLTLFPHLWPLPTKQLILSLIIYKTCMSSTNKKLRIPQ